MQIALLQCDSIDERFHQHSGGDYPQMFTRLLDSTNQFYELHVFDATLGQLPENPEQYKGIIITGSWHSAYDDQPWIQKLKSFVRQVADKKHKIIGICFGHQILAQALGGRVEKSNTGWGIGLHTVRINKQHDWMQPPLTDCNLIFSHQDQVYELPLQAEIIAASEHCAIQMFTINDHILGMQGHPEMLTPHIQELMQHHIEKIGHAQVAQGRESLEQLSNDGEIVGHWMVNFLLSY